MLGFVFLGTERKLRWKLEACLCKVCFIFSCGCAICIFSLSHYCSFSSKNIRSCTAFLKSEIFLNSFPVTLLH